MTATATACRVRDPWFGYSGRAHAEPVPDRPALAIEHLRVSYPGASAWALDAVSIRVMPGERIAVVGPNGAGKSTLLRAACGLVRPTSGTIAVYGQPVGACHHRTAYLPQRGELDWAYPVDVQALVMMGRYVHLGWFARPGREDRRIVAARLERLGLSDLARRQIGELSGGQQQRALLARALVQDASLFLLDEPLSALDAESRTTIEHVLAEEAARGGAVIAATHEIGTLDRYDRAVRLEAGRVRP